MLWNLCTASCKLLSWARVSVGNACSFNYCLHYIFLSDCNNATNTKNTKTSPVVNYYCFKQMLKGAPSNNINSLTNY